MTDARREPVARWDVQIYQDGAWEDIESPTGKWVRYDDYRALAERLAASEAQVKELEHEANQEGQQFRQFAEEILPPGMCVATEGVISFGKLKEVVEAAIAVPTRELAKLKQRLAEMERSAGLKPGTPLVMREADVLSIAWPDESCDAALVARPLIDQWIADKNALTDAQATIARLETEREGWKDIVLAERQGRLKAEQQVARLRESLVEYMTLADKICYAEPEYTQYHNMKTKASQALRETGA